MHIIPADDKSIGYRLAEDLFDESGRRLLARSTRISAAILQLLKARGIKNVKVEDETAFASSTTADTDNLSSTRQTVPDYFKNWDPALLPQDILKLINTINADRKSDIFLPTRNTNQNSKDSLPETALDSILETTGLFTLPEVYYHITTVLSSPKASAGDVAEAIATDVAFTTRLLQVANSSLYSLNKRIVSIHEAVSYIGLDQLAVLSIGIAFTRSLQSISLESSSMQNFWIHSMATGTAAKLLAGFLGHKKTEVYFIAGLLHDLGKMLIYNAIPDSAHVLHTRCKKEGREQQELEQQILGFDHALVGARFINKYSLPKELSDIIAWHHQPENANDPGAARIVHLADILTNALRLGSSGQYLVPVPQTIKNETYRDENIRFLQATAQTIRESTGEMIRIIFHEQTDLIQF